MKTITQEHYIYELIDPRTHITFYVGKGKGDRLADHVKKYKRNSKYQSNSDKIAHIESIIKSGHEVIEKITARFDTQEEALDAEHSLIMKYGIENLTNKYIKGGVYIYHKYEEEGFLNGARLMVSMLARAKSMQHEHTKNYKETGILSIREVYDIMLEEFKRYCTCTDRKHFMDILNEEIDKKWQGTARTIT